MQIGTVAKNKFLSGALVAAGLLGCFFVASHPMIAQNPESKAAEQKEKNLAAAEKEAKRLLLLMDKDRSGKVSKQEFMSFMEAEFDRLDVNHDGELDVKELTQTQVRVRTRGR